VVLQAAGRVAAMVVLLVACKVAATAVWVAEPETEKVAAGVPGQQFPPSA